ncbi:LCP family protein [Intrasporangium sp.]|uniref:LCP family protein n=1 Tax=Intrasporangium sp. TaxID=1925024 RepID=UPI0033659FE5
MSNEPTRPTTGSGGRRSLRREHAVGFRRALGLTALGTLVPGAGLTRTRRKVWGWVLLAISLALLGLVVAGLATRGLRRFGLDVITHSAALTLVIAVSLVGGVVWCASIIATAVLARPRSLDRSRTRALAIFTTIMVIVVGSAAFKASEYAFITKETVVEVFSGGDLKPGEGAVVVEGEDPWADTPRVNILLLGSDAGVGRTGTRTDSMVVASVDTKSGRTVLISLPRNFQRVPLPRSSKLRDIWPSGTYGVPTCPRQQINASDQCMLNAIWTEVDDYRARNPDAYSGVAVPGRSELRDVISEIVGLKINHMVVIDLKGFQQLIDAMGGVDVNIKLAGPNGDQPLPYGKDYGNGRYSDYFTRSGVHHLTGYQALWYARTRAADGDFQRQSRQRCVIKAVLGQVRPSVMITKYPQLARIARDNIYTDVPADTLPAFAELVERIQKSSIDSLAFTPADGFDPARPDYGRLRRLVQAAIESPPAPSATRSTPLPTTSAPRTGAPTATPSRTPPANTAHDECA